MRDESALDLVLQAREVCAGYGKRPVVTDLNLSVHAGEVVVLLGANGAGKTTSLLTLAGALPPISGEVRIFGRPSKAAMHRRCRDGLAYVSEERSVFGGLTARENLRVGGCPVQEAIAVFPELEALLDRRGGLLSGGEQQMLTLARALGRNPRLLLADELSLGLAPLVVRRLLSSVRQAASEHGVGVLLVEQHVEQAMRIADTVYVMRRGNIAFSGTASDLTGRMSDIRATYLAHDAVRSNATGLDGA